MKVYLDIIMIINFFIDFILLMSVSILLKRNSRVIDMLKGAFIGGLSILLLLFKISNILLFTLKIFIGLLMCLITFKYKNIKYTLINFIYLFLNSIVLGGGIYFINLELIKFKVKLIFINSSLEINFIILVIFSPIIIYIYIRQIKLLKNNYLNYYNISININKKNYNYIAYMDSGNDLIDNITNKKVILIDKRKILFDIKEFRLIPYMSVNGLSMIKVIKINYLYFNDKKYNDVLLGIMDEISLDGVDVILNRNLMED